MRVLFLDGSDNTLVCVEAQCINFISGPDIMSIEDCSCFWESNSRVIRFDYDDFVSTAFSSGLLDLSDTRYRFVMRV